MSQQRYHLTRGKMTYNDPIPVKEFTNQTYMRQAIDFLGSYKK
jgi:hypothetical protein